MEIPGESTRARRSGRGSHVCLGPEPRGVRATRARARAPSPGPRGKKRRRSHAVSGSLSFQNKATTPRGAGGRTGREELLRETEAEDQKCWRWASVLLAGPAPWLGCTATASTFRPRPAVVSKEGRPPIPHTQSPNPWSGVHAILPPSLRPKALGFRLLLPANFLPLEKAANSVWGFAAKAMGPPRILERAHDDHSLGAAGGRAVHARPGSPRPLAGFPSSDPRPPGPGARPFCLPLATHAHLARPTRLLARAGGALAPVSPGTAAAGAGTARRAPLRPGAGDWGLRGTEERAALAPLAPPCLRLLSGRRQQQ